MIALFIRTRRGRLGKKDKRYEKEKGMEKRNKEGL